MNVTREARTEQKRCIWTLAGLKARDRDREMRNRRAMERLTMPFCLVEGFERLRRVKP